MTEFDPTAYFNRLNSEQKAEDASGVTRSKYNDLVSAKIRAVAALTNRANELQARKDAVTEASKNSWVTKQGVDPDSVLGHAMNLAASAYSGLSRQIGDVVGLAEGDLEAMLRTGGLSDEQISAVGRYRQGKASEADMALITARKHPNSYNAIENMDMADAARKRSALVNESFDQSGVVHTGRRAQLSADLGDNFQGAWDQTKAGTSSLWNGDAAGVGDLLAGVGKLIFNAGEAAVSNPGAAAEYMAENLPQLAAGVLGKAGKAALLASNVGYASENYQQGIAKYQAENGGALPPLEERQKMAALAASLALAEHVGELGQIKAATGAAQAAKDTARIGLVQSLKNTGKAAATGFGEEALTEGYQTWAEGEVTGKPATAKDIYEGAVIGGLAGGGLSGGGRALGELTKSTPEHVAANAAQAEEILARRETQQKAIETGDVSQLLDAKSKYYDPSRAIYALNGNSQLDTATEESRQSNLEQAGRIVADLESRHQNEVDALKAMTPEGIAERQAKADEAKAAGDTEYAALLQESIDESKKVSSKDLKAREAAVAKSQERLDRAREALDNFAVEKTTAAAQGTTPDPAPLINLSMASPGQVDVNTATELANDQTNNLSASQRQYLNAFVEARKAETVARDLAGVNQQVLDGGNGNLGLSQYRARITSALLAGNGPLVAKQLGLLRNFAESHASKAEALQAAVDKGVPHKPAFVATVRAESRAISAVLAELEAAQAAKFSQPSQAQPSPQEVNDVQNVSQSHDSTQDVRPGTQVQAVEGAGEAAGDTAAGTSAELSTGSEGSRGVSERDGVVSPSLAFRQRIYRLISKKSNLSEAESVLLNQLPADLVDAAYKVNSIQAGLAQSEEVLMDEDLDQAREAASKAIQALQPKISELNTEIEKLFSAQQTENSSVEIQSKTVKSTASTEATSSSESPEETSADHSGQSVAISKKSAANTSYQQQELVGDHFTQTAGKEGDATSRPLVKVKDFLSQGWDKATEFLKNTELTEKQQDLLKDFQTTAKEWFGTIQSNLTRRNRDFWFEDLMQFFMTEDGGKLDLEENTKTAMVYAGVSWLAEQQGKDPYNTDEDINAILGRDSEARVEEHERDALRFVGTRMQVVANGLGQRAVQALGLKAKSSAPLDLQPKLESQLGMHILKLLVDQGYLVKSELSADAMAKLRSNVDANAKHYFIKVVDGTKTKDLFDAVRGTGSILDKLFSVEPGLKEPTREAVPFIQKTTKNTNQAVPSKLAEIQERENAAEWRVRQDMFSLLEVLSDDIALDIAGGKSEEEAKVQKTKRSANKAKNDGLRREIQRAREFFTGLRVEDGTLSMPIHFEHSVWKQQRVGISTNMINPQTSKVHRHMLYLGAWESTIRLDNQAEMENFQLRVLEGLGVKTDKQGNEKSLASFEAVTGQPQIKAAVDVLLKFMAEDSLSEQDQKVLAAGVSKGGENMHSLDALMALAHMQFAQQRGKNSFTVQLMGEVDGVTNGPMLSHLLMGAAESADKLFELLNRGGFFQLGNEHSQYNQWRGAPGNFDLYERTASNVVKAMRKLMAEGVKSGNGKLVLAAKTVKDAGKAIEAFTGTLMDANDVVKKPGRDIVKTPLTALVFGSAVSKSVDSMADRFIEGIYDAIEKAANGKGDLTAADIVKHVNTLLEIGGGPKLKGRYEISNLMDGDFNLAQVAGLKKAFTMTLGEAVKTTLNEDFATFIEKRRQFNVAAQTSFELYNSVRQALRDQMVNQGVKDGTIAFKEVSPKGPDGKADKKAPKIKVPIHDLTKAQEAELDKKLRDLFPVLHTAFSKESNQLRAGLVIAKTNRKLSQRPTFEGNVKFGTAFPDGTTNATTRGYEVVSEAPGAAMAPMSVHSLDSYISHIAAAMGQVLNVHDAHGAGLNNFEETARNLNQATWNAMMVYSPASEMQAALARTVQGLAKLLESGDLDPAVVDSLKAAVAKLAGPESDPTTFVRDTLTATTELAASADKVKFDALSKMQAIDQYALEGGNYVVTDADRAAAAEKLAAVSEVLSPEVSKALDVIEKALAGTTKSKTATDTELDPALVKSPFGTVGPANVASEPALVEFFNENPTPTAEQLVKQLYSILKERTGRSAELNLQLLRLVSRVVPKDLSIQLVTPQTTAENVLEAPKQPSVGWFVSKDGQARIHLLSSEFQNSGLTVETVLHELIHGSLAEVVASELAKEKANPKYRSEALELVQELEELRDKAKAYAKQNGITQFGEALGDVQEFITYGLTNQAFQRQVLSQVAMKSRTQGNSLVNGMKAFVEKVVGILFRGSSKDVQAQATNGLTVLVTNVSGLFNQAAQVNKAESKATGINLSQVILRDLSTVDLHEALDGTGLTPEFSDRLKGLLSSIVFKLHGPFGALKEQAMKQQALTPLDVWTKAYDSGTAPLPYSTLGSPLQATEQEKHAIEQVEAVARAALDSKEAPMASAYKDLERVFKEASKAITAADMGGQAAHDFLFKIDVGADGRSNYLARFAAYALAHQEFSGLLAKKLSVSGPADVKTAKSFGERVQIIFEKILAFLHDRANGTFTGQRADARIGALLDHLVDIEAKRRMQVLRASSLLNLVDDKASDALNQAKAKAQQLLNSNAVRNSKFSWVRAGGKVANLSMEGRIEVFLDTLKNYRDWRFKSMHGVGMQLLTEIRGPGQILNLLSLASTNAQRMRKDLISSTAKHARMAFANGGKGITKKASAAITQVFLRSGAHSLLGRFNMVELEQLLSDPKALAKAVADTETQLGQFGQFKDQFIHQANALAYFKVTGAAKHARLMVNAHNIARLYGTEAVGKISEQDAKAAEKHIEQLVALYALGYMDSKDLRSANEVLRAELQRTDGQGNGIEYTLQLQKRFEQEANDRIFQDQKALMMHGYTPEILNPNIQVVAATRAEGNELLKQGYKEVGLLELDSADPDQTPKFLYAVRDGGLMPYRSGVASLTGKRAKGDTAHNGYLNLSTNEGLHNASMNADILHDKRGAAKLASGPRPDLAKQGKTHMVPIVNPHGEIVNWRYVMQDKTRNEVLERDNSFDKLLGMIAGSTFDKQASLEVNTQTFEALREIDKAERNLNPDGFVLIGPNVMRDVLDAHGMPVLDATGQVKREPDIELRQIWSMLPEDTRKVARSLWGREGMWVRKDQLTTVFGYRKYSLADALRKDPSQRNVMERLFAEFAEFALGDKATLRVAQGERVWQDVVREMKDTIVVKSITVSLGNISSNISLLLAQGVPLKDILRGHLVALRGARAYMADQDELQRLQSIVDNGLAGTRLASMVNEINRLQDSLNRNPVKELIDAGLMPTIVEDIAEEDDMYSYKSALVRKVDQYTSKLPNLVKEAGKQLYMGKDTKVYQGLSRLAQVSDFAARYALYQHLTSRKNKPLDKSTAVHEASEAFINYDIPMPKWLQYTDDMGITMFTKYVTRIQRVLAKVVQEHPTRVLTMLTIDQFANLGPIVLDSSWVHKLGHNPLNWGALQAPGAMDELATVQAAMALVK